MSKMKIDFDVDAFNYDFGERLVFWETARPWLLERGYTMNRHESRNGGYACLAVPQFPFEGEVHHPYSFFGGDPEDSQYPPLMIDVQGQVVYAQDKQHRHVVIKLMKKHSPEHQILQRLSQEPSLYFPDNFSCVIPPLELLDFEEHCFAVMPRWGDCVSQPWFLSMQEVLDFIHCLLKGLGFLHKNHICHRDIKAGNLLVNHFGIHLYYNENNMRRELRCRGQLVYALFDFDLAIMFPPMSTPEQRRLPARESFSIANWSFDTSQGELDFDPFAFDVGALGILFCQEFQHLTIHAPMLAPLFDGMISRDIPKRFTAAEALQFFEDSYSLLTQSQLTTHVEHAPVSVQPEEYDRWASLPEEFVQRWSSYRLPKLPWSTVILRRLCWYTLGYATVQWVRRLRRTTVKWFNHMLGLELP